MGRTVLHMEPVMQGGPKRPTGTSQLRRKMRGLHSTGGTGRRGYDCSAPQKKSCDLHPGKTAAETGRAKRAAEFRDELRTPKRLPQRGSRAPAPILGEKLQQARRVKASARASSWQVLPASVRAGSLD